MDENKISIVKFLKNTKILKSLNDEQINNLLEIPPSSDLGDFAFPCFVLAKELKMNPAQISEKLKNDLDLIKLPSSIEKMETKGPYINFFLNKQNLSKKTLEEIKKLKDKYGSSQKGRGKKIMIEFSQPNTHKAFHVGHIRGTSLGESLSRILEFYGYNIARVNYSGDTGMHIAKWIWCYKKYHSKEKLRLDESWIASIYVDAVKRLSQNEKLQSEVDEINRKIESREDKEINSLWKKTRELSIKSWEKIYRQLNTHFDRHYFESEVELNGKNIGRKLVDQGIAKISDEATIVDLEKFNLGIWVVLRRDGTVLYSAKDLALSELKFKEFKNLTKSIVIVGDEQDMYFKQLSKVLELINLINKDKYTHIPFGMVRLPQGKMSSRTGDNILYSDFINEVITSAKKGIKKRTPKISFKELDERALKISIAAIKYAMLKQDARKVIVFNKDDALNFEGNTGPYLLYSYARASSIIRKSKSSKKIKEQNSQDEKDESENKLIKLLSEFPDIVEKSFRQLDPSQVANYSYELSKAFNEFYHSSHVIGSDEEEYKLKLVNSFRQVLKNSLKLLGIDVIEEM